MPRCMQVATHITGQHDFLEGVRAAVVDKDRQPQWQPSSLSAVNSGKITALLECPPKLKDEFAQMLDA